MYTDNLQCLILLVSGIDCAGRNWHVGSSPHVGSQHRPASPHVLRRPTAPIIPTTERARHHGATGRSSRTRCSPTSRWCWRTKTSTSVSLQITSVGGIEEACEPYLVHWNVCMVGYQVGLRGLSSNTSRSPDVEPSTHCSKRYRFFSEPHSLVLMATFAHLDLDAS